MKAGIRFPVHITNSITDHFCGLGRTGDLVSGQHKNISLPYWFTLVKF